MIFVFVFLVATTLASTLPVSLPAYITTSAAVGASILALGELCEKTLVGKPKKELSDHLTISNATFSVQYAVKFTAEALNRFARSPLWLRALVSVALTATFIFLWSAVFVVTIVDVTLGQFILLIAIQPQTYANFFIDFVVLLLVIASFRFISNISQRFDSHFVLSLVFFAYCTLVVLAATYLVFLSMIIGIYLAAWVNGDLTTDLIISFPAVLKTQVLSLDVPLRSLNFFWGVEIGEPGKIAIGSNDQPDFLGINALNLMKVYYFSTMVFPMLIFTVVAFVTFAPLIYTIQRRFTMAETEYDPETKPYNSLALSLAVFASVCTFLALITLI